MPARKRLPDRIPAAFRAACADVLEEKGRSTYRAVIESDPELFLEVAGKVLTQQELRRMADPPIDADLDLITGRYVERLREGTLDEGKPARWLIN